MEINRRCISPKKNPANRNLTFGEIERNNHHTSDRVLIEDYFGKLGTLWAMVGKKYLWAQSSYYRIMWMCLALTDLHISKTPLRDGDGDVYQNMRKKLYQIGEEIGLERNRQQHKYRSKVMSRLCDDSDDGLMTPSTP